MGADHGLAPVERPGAQIVEAHDQFRPRRPFELAAELARSGELSFISLLALRAIASGQDEVAFASKSPAPSPMTFSRAR